MSRRVRIAWAATLLLLLLLASHSCFELGQNPDYQEPDVFTLNEHDEIVNNAPRKMRASWYCPGFAGRPTASGERYDCDAHTAAHRRLPFGTRLLLRNPKTDAYIVVRVNDRGPYAQWHGKTYYRDPRDLDVSEHVAETLGFREQGIATLEVWTLP